MKAKRPGASLWSVCLAGLIMAGCASPSPFRQDLKVQGALPLIQPESFEKIDLARELDPQSPALIEGLYLKDEELAQNRETLRKAFDRFYEDRKSVELRRNRMQERILAASNQRCGEYKKFLKQLDAGTNFFLGALTTVVAGAGAIVTGPATAVRALSGSASIVSGVKAEFNETYFQNKTIQVLTDGIEAKRKELYEKILEVREGKDIEEYTVEAAIKDAITYHDACSLIAGLEHAALSIERASNPGAEAAMKFMEKLPGINNALQNAVSPKGSGSSPTQTR